MIDDIVFAGRGLQPRPKRFLVFLLDGVCNPVRNVFSQLL